MLECVLGLLAWVSEFSEKLRFNNWMWLSDDQVVSLWIFVKSVFQEIS
jgi:hypothetical protein